MGWLHAYNEHGPEALAYRRSGGRPPFAPMSLRPSAKRPAPRSSKQAAHP
jgi:hypothetical protein